MMAVAFSPVYSWVLVALLAGVLAACILWSGREGLKRAGRRRALGGVRFGALALMVLLLSQPQRRVDEITVIKPQLAVLVDDSESMEDHPDVRQPTRAQRVREWFGSPAFAAAKEHFEIRTFRFDVKPSEWGGESGGLNFKGAGSNMIAALQHARDRFVGQPLAGMLVLSDGLDTSGVGNGFTLPSGLPVHTFELEKPFVLPDKPKRMWISSLDPPGRIVVGWDAEVRGAVSGSGMAGRTLSVELWRDGAKTAETTVTFNEDEQTRPVVFPIAGTEPGVMQLEMRLNDPAADPDAKTRHFAIEVVAPGKRILYVQNSFGFEFKFLRRAVAGDRNLQLQAFVRSGDGKLVAMGDRGALESAKAPKLEFSQAGLSSYAVVVLGDLPPEALTGDQYKALREFVDRGGGLVLLGGAAGMGSGEIAKTALLEMSPAKLPAEYKEGKFPVKITDAGLRHPVLGPLFANVKEFPALLSVNIAKSSAPSAEVLIEAEDAGTKFPVVVATRFGNGRVVSVMTDSVWHWRMGAKSWSSERSPYDVFWSQMMEWLIPKEQDKQGVAKLELLTERPTYTLGEQPEVRAILELGSSEGKPPATLPLSVRTPDGKVFEYKMKQGQFPAGGKMVNGYVTQVDPNVPGMFTARSHWEAGKTKLEAETRFSISKPATEKTGRPIDRELLERVAQQTGGHFFKWEEREEWPGFVHAKEQQIARVRLQDLWNHPVLLLLLLAFLSADWILRKRWNLP
jgi:uncharacterized membrane protein